MSRRVWLITETLVSWLYHPSALCVKVQALRAIEQYLGLEKLYVLGTNCVDNGPREGLEKFLKAASTSPETVLHYEFMQVCSCHAGMLIQVCFCHWNNQVCACM